MNKLFKALLISLSIIPYILLFQLISDFTKEYEDIITQYNTTLEQAFYTGCMTTKPKQEMICHEASTQYIMSKGRMVGQ